MRRKATTLIVWFLAILLSPLQAAEERVISKFSSTAPAKSLSFSDEGPDEDPGFRGLFRGFGGYQLEHVGADERSWINIQFGKATVNLYEATMAAGGGTFPHKANDVVEWRGVEKDGRFTPYAIIYRLKAGNDETRVWHTRLIVIKLDRERSAVIGHATGRHQDALAKQIADRGRPQLGRR